MAETQFTPFMPTNPAVVDAFLRCNRVAAQGFEQLAKHWIDTARETFEQGVEQQRRLSSINTLTDLAAWQGQVAQDSLQNILTRGRELSDLGTAVARDVVASFTEAAAESTTAAADAAQSAPQANTVDPSATKSANPKRAPQ